MPRTLSPSSSTPRGPVVLAALLACLACGCGRQETPPTRVEWFAGHAEPAFDPFGPPDPVRHAIERLLSRGLVDEDAEGNIVPAGAYAVRATDEGRTLTFKIDPELRFADGTRCTSADFQESLLRGVAREDHATVRWLLRAVHGVSRVRPGRALPSIGIEAPDDSTLVLTLDRADPRLLHALALPGVGVPWRDAAGAEGWAGRAGTGAYRVVGHGAGRRLVLARSRAQGWTGADSIHVRFVRGGITPAVLRSGAGDLLWPIAMGDRLRGEAVPGYRWQFREARPQRLLVLVLRPDVAPTARVAARRALSHGINWRTLTEIVGPAGLRPIRWWEGGASFDLPAFDAAEVRSWMSRGKLGRSFRTVLAYDPDEVSPALVRSLQEGWAQMDLLVDPKSLRGAAFVRERASGRAQLLLAIIQPASTAPGDLLAMLATPDRAGAVGGLRTGWRPDGLDRLLRDGEGGVNEHAAAESRIAGDVAVLPLARVGWSYAEREGSGEIANHPRYGPDLARRVTADIPISLKD